MFKRTHTDFYKLLHLTLLVIFGLFIGTSSFAEQFSDHDNSKFNIGVTTEILNAGGLSIEDEQLLGIEARYYFSTLNNFNNYMSVDIKTDIDNEGSSVDIYNIDIGSEFDFATFWNNTAFVNVSVGAAYIREDFTTTLIDRAASNTFNEFSLKGSFGLGVTWKDSFSTEFFLNQYGSNYRTIGLGVSHLF